MTRNLDFSKYQASGNDFLLLEDLFDTTVLKPDDVTGLCDRRRGIGADGVIRVTRGAAAHFAMHLTNADGSSAEVSGNGLRCAAAFLHDRDLWHVDAVELETPAGVRRVMTERLPSGAAVAAVVEMGRPTFERGGIPMTGDPSDTFLLQPVPLDDGRTALASAVGFGNAHLVIFVPDETDLAGVERLGRVLERDVRFPERTNVELAYVASDGAIDVRVWERGVGETLACGTGACAVAAAARHAGPTSDRLSVRFPGGTLEVERRAGDELFLRGPVMHVFDGFVDLDRL
jgi:diaminopimelate epimerase